MTLWVRLTLKEEAAFKIQMEDTCTGIQDNKGWDDDLLDTPMDLVVVSNMGFCGNSLW